MTPSEVWTNLLVNLFPRYNQHSHSRIHGAPPIVAGGTLLTRPSLKCVVSYVKQNSEQQWSTKYDEKSLNSVWATHSGQGITHRGFCSHVNLVCYIHTISLSFFEPIFPGFWNLPSARSLSESRTRLPLANPPTVCK